MGSFTYGFVASEADGPAQSAPAEKKVVAAAGLRGRGLNVIAASLEDAQPASGGGAVRAGREEAWARAVGSDVVDLVRRRTVSR